MTLAKSFHHPAGRPGRQLRFFLTSSCDPAPAVAMVGEGSEGSRRECASPAEAVAVFLSMDAELTAAGYVEVMPNQLPAADWTPVAKADWQRALDEATLRLLALDATASRPLLAPLADTAVAEEPLYLWLAAAQSIADQPGEHRHALALAQQARDALAAQRADQAPFYRWSFRDAELEGFICDLICLFQLYADDPDAALAAAEHANEVAPDKYRGGRIAWVLFHHFPDREEEAFELAFRDGRHGGYEELVAEPAYAEYVERRRRKGGKGWRWSVASEPASADELRAAEHGLGVTLPDDYRGFLAAGRTELVIRVEGRSSALRFFRPAELIKQRDNLFRFITRTGADKASAYFHQQYGVSLRDLVPVAEPRDVSANVIIHLGGGDRFGWCYRWHHDGAWELESPQPGIDQMIRTLVSNIEERDPVMLDFLGMAVR